MRNASAPELRFTIHGQIVSANNFKAPDANGRLRKTRLAIEDAKRVRRIATTASAGWEIPQAVAVYIDAHNSRLDADNVSKVLLDALKGLAFHDDADMMTFSVFRRWDREGERYAVTITPAEDRRPGRNGKPRAKRVGDGLPDSGLVSFEQLEQMKRSGLV